MRWGAAWKGQPPLLMQCRDLLAQIAAMLSSGLGERASPMDFIPQRGDAEQDRIEAERQQMLLWAARHNAGLQ